MDDAAPLAPWLAIAAFCVSGPAGPVLECADKPFVLPGRLPRHGLEHWLLGPHLQQCNCVIGRWGDLEYMQQIRLH